MHTQLDQVSSTPSTELPTGQPAELLANVQHQTPWTRLQLLELADTEVVGVSDTEEAVLLLLQGEGESVSGHRLRPPAVLRAVAQSVAFRARGAARVLIAGVALGQGRPTAEASDELGADRLAWRDSIHGGSGRIATRHIWRPEDFSGDAWTYVDHAILGADSSLGAHYHETGEEAFIVLAGQGLMTIGDDTFPIGPGSVTYQPAGVGHGLYNPHEAGLDFVRFAVGMPGQAFTTTDLNEDVRHRQPGERT